MSLPLLLLDLPPFLLDLVFSTLSLSLSLFVRVCDYSVLIESFSESLCVWGCSVLIFVFFCFEPLTN